MTDFTAIQPTITAISASNSQPAIGTSVFITASVTNATTSGVFLAYRNAGSSPFLRIQMFDDGLHGDGNANDGVFGATVNVSSGKTEYYLYAENAQTGIFSPQRADVEFYTLIAQAPAGGNLVINEFLASNVSTVADQDGEFDDWIEILNHTDEIIQFDSIYLSDSYNNLLKWKFPDGTVIQPHSYLTVWADDDGLQAGLHASFKLSATGERIALTHSATGVIDSISFGFQTADISMQRCPDDTGSFVFAVPSFGTSNNCPTSISEEMSNSEVIAFPNPCIANIQIQSLYQEINTVRIINLIGQTVFQQQGIHSSNLAIDLAKLPNGLYMIVINDTIYRKIIKK